MLFYNDIVLVRRIPFILRSSQETTSATSLSVSCSTNGHQVVLAVQIINCIDTFKRLDLFVHELFQSGIRGLSGRSLCLCHKPVFSSVPDYCNINFVGYVDVLLNYKRAPVHLLKPQRVLCRVFTHPSLWRTCHFALSPRFTFSFRTVPQSFSLMHIQDLG